MPDIAYYVSSHGYGHAARQQAVIDQLAKQGMRVHVRTATPRKFFKSATSYHRQRYDIGMIQHDALTFDIPTSLDAVQHFMESQSDLIQQELAFIDAENIALIVSDMPPIACDIASSASIPSVVVTHFTWDWVYQHYVDEYPQFQPIVDSVRRQYHQATLALQMQHPLPHAFDMFPTVEPVPLVYNTVTESRADIRTQFAVPDDMPMVLLSMGGHQWGMSNLEKLLSYHEAIFLVMPSAWSQVQHRPTQFRQVPTEFDNYHNLIAASDVVVGKAGGSTVAEVLGHQTPMIYTTQGDQWRESKLLARTLDNYASAQYIPMTDFISGDWVDCLPEFLHKKHDWHPIARDGAHVIANRLLEILNK